MSAILASMRRNGQEPTKAERVNSSAVSDVGQLENPEVVHDGPMTRSLRERLDNTASANRISALHDRTGFDPERFNPGNGPDPVKQRGLVHVLLRQLTEHDPEAGRAGREWFDRHDTTMTTAQRSDWINRIRAKLATLGTSRDPSGAVNYGRAIAGPAPTVDPLCECRLWGVRGCPVHMTTDTPPVVAAPERSAWTEWRKLGAELAVVGGHPSGTRFAVDNAPGSDNDVSFWWINVGRDGRAYLRQVIGGQGPVRVRMRPEDMVTIARRIIDAGSHAAMIRFGQLIGSCGDCGRTLTNKESRDAGIGPVCANRGH